MRFLAGCVLVLLGVTFAQSQLVVPQFDHLNGMISALPEIQNLLSNLDKMFPQLNGVLSLSELQDLKKQIVQLLLSQVGGNLNINTIKDKLRPIIQQFLASKPQGRINLEGILQEVLNAVLPSLSGLLGGLIGKREVNEARAGLADILALADQLDLNSILPLLSQLLTPAQLAEIQDQFFNIVVTGLGDNWNIPTVAQALQQLVSSFVPQVAQMRIDWGALAHSALTGLTNALPGMLLSTLLGKRSLVASYQQLLSELSSDKLAQLVAIVNSADKSQVLAKLRKLLQQFFPAYQGRINFDDLAASVLAHLNGLLPILSHSMFQQMLG